MHHGVCAPAPACSQSRSVPIGMSPPMTRASTAHCCSSRFPVRCVAPSLWCSKSRRPRRRRTASRRSGHRQHECPRQAPRSRRPLNLTVPQLIRIKACYLRLPTLSIFLSKRPALLPIWGRQAERGDFLFAAAELHVAATECFGSREAPAGVGVVRAGNMVALGLPDVAAQPRGDQPGRRGSR